MPLSRQGTCAARSTDSHCGGTATAWLASASLLSGGGGGGGGGGGDDDGEGGGEGSGSGDGDGGGCKGGGGGGGAGGDGDGGGGEGDGGRSGWAEALTWSSWLQKSPVGQWALSACMRGEAGGNTGRRPRVVRARCARPFRGVEQNFWR